MTSDVKSENLDYPGINVRVVSFFGGLQMASEVTTGLAMEPSDLVKEFP